ncbi:SBBP repeat-containing protein [Hymenobacter sp. YC55]|uniref:SBBP repeat-containing protein n=1 Tax=Hymenobacter sp. YC55 TaxID=3034019 RepID=UPI0023F63ACF|nr:SBBP repeat-containing protein [Hymenobacter sp. YC55]MDF7812051.1 SBBP repeat-containing protein [Hymenobacter sp. YC55]
MKQSFTCLLPLAAGLLFVVPTTQAQTRLAPASIKKQKPLLAPVQEFVLPPGARALHHALPKGTSAVSKRTATNQVTQDAQVAASKSIQAPAAGPVAEAWAARYSGPTASYDLAAATTTDAEGNVYVTGTASSVFSIDYDYVTVKYSATGEELWNVRYNGSGNSDDVPKGIAVDAAGNVYVTGGSFARTGNYGYATVKYDGASGQQLWAARYDGAANSDDLATSLAVDGAGNVLVTGASYNGPASSYDYVTVKYSSVGAQLWSARYSGSGSSDELPTTLAVDASGNVYVTGNAYAGNQGDYLTLKYSTAGGQPLWVARYNGPASGYDLVRDLAVDAAGNVVVTGTSDNGSSYDYATVRYSSSGQQQWAMRYNGAGNSYDEASGVALDAAGNVAVTGFADVGGGNWDYVTLKYEAASGQPLWEARYNGSDSSYEEAKDVVVDAAGNVAVTGRSYNSAGQSEYATVKYAGASGQPLWASRYNRATAGDEQAVSLAVDAGGNVVVTGISNTSTIDADYATLKYAAASGQQLWEARYTDAQAINNDDQAKDIAVDAAGNVYVTGSSAGSGSRYDYATIKYSASGAKLWEARYDGPGDSFDTAISVAVDAAGNVYVTGTSNSDYATVKYSPSGQQLWVARYNGPANTMDAPNEVVVDAAGNVYVTGFSIGTGTSYDYATIKYAPTGEELWVARYNGAGASNDQASALAVDATGNVYVTGATYGRFDYLTVKYSASGQQLWEAPYSGVGNGNGTATDIAVDASGNVLVTGQSIGTTGSYDYATVKYASSGQQLWATRYNGPGNRSDQAAKLAVDPTTGHVYVTGRSYSGPAFSSSDYATLKYDGASGQQLWVTRYNGPGNGVDVATDVALDAAGNAYVTGYSDNTSSSESYDYATLKYEAATGQQLWDIRYDGVPDRVDQANGLAVDAAGNVYVTGSSYSLYVNTDFATIKYVQTSTTASAGVVAATRSVLAAAGSNVQELAVYPNPAAGQASVSFRPVQDGAAQVRVYNQLGQQVATLYEGKVHKGQHYELPLHSQKLAPGLYTCSLLVNGQRETVRVVISH